MQALLIALVVLAAILAVVRFERFCLRDLAEAPDYELRFFNRQGWSALIILCIPMGGLLYLSVGRWR